jgi:hypothetical protein
MKNNVIEKLKRLWASLRSRDVPLFDSKLIDQDLRQIFQELCERNASFAESDLKYVFIYGRFTTGNEWLREIRYTLNRLLEERLGDIPPAIEGRMRTMISDIQQWLDYANRTAVRVHPLAQEPQEPSAGPKTLKEWIRDQH